MDAAPVRTAMAYLLTHAQGLLPQRITLLSDIEYSNYSTHDIYFKLRIKKSRIMITEEPPHQLILNFEFIIINLPIGFSSLYEVHEQRVRLQYRALVFGVKLCADVPFQLRYLNNLHQV